MTEHLNLFNFKDQMQFLTEFAALYEASYEADVNSPRTKALRRLCKSQLTEVRNSLKVLLDDEEE